MVNRERTVIHIYTIYWNPSDYPRKYVVRRSTIGAGRSLTVDPHPLAVESTLEAARAVVPNYCVQLSRDPNDDPAILEVWL